MKITKRGEYALKALLTLAAASASKKTLSLREIANSESIPYKFLEQIMGQLKQSGFLVSSKGQHGGYALSRHSKEITLGEVIRSVEGPLAPIENAKVLQKMIQTEKEHPGLYAVLLEVRDAVAKILDRKTLADVCEKSFELANSKSSYEMYHI